MTNLLAETDEAISKSGHTPGDIIFIGSEDTGHRCTWDEFVSLADFEYNSDFGVAHIADDLKIVFKDGATMWRGEYDGKEWWEYSAPFVAPQKDLPIRSLGGSDGAWNTLSELNG
jgi:hypothetical protein